MTYKLLKLIEPEESSIPLGSLFDIDGFYLQMDNGMQVSTKMLIAQGFIEEVKDVPKINSPRWKVGDFIVAEKSYNDLVYLVITKVTYSPLYNTYKYDNIPDCVMRDPTPEELSIYFK